MGNPSLPVSSQIFERIESGGRAIDPLYRSALQVQNPYWSILNLANSNRH